MIVSVLSLPNARSVSAKLWKFPVGESGVSLGEFDSSGTDCFRICVYYESDRDIIQSLLIADALRRGHPHAKIELWIPYFPYSRQDRVTAPGEPHSLQVISSIIVNSGLFDQVLTHDPHSTVLEALFPAGMLKCFDQADILSELILDEVTNDMSNVVLVAPDQGASKKTMNLAKVLGVEHVLESRKIRVPTTGEIKGIAVEVNESLLTRKDLTFIVSDDIIDGGMTFRVLHEELLKHYTPEKTVLVATHGFFTKGKNALSMYDQVSVCFDHYKEV